MSGDLTGLCLCISILNQDHGTYEFLKIKYFQSINQGQWHGGVTEVGLTSSKILLHSLCITAYPQNNFNFLNQYLLSMTSLHSP